MTELSDEHLDLVLGRGTADHDAGHSNLELFLARQRLGLDLGPELLRLNGTARLTHFQTRIKRTTPSVRLLAGALK